MKRNLLSALIYLACTSCLFAQSDPVLLRINNEEVTRSEFEYIYNKHNSQNVLEKKTLPEYMELFINFKLKVAAAQREGLDTTNAFKDELNGYRMQVAKSYLTDEDAERYYLEQLYEEMKIGGKAHRVKILQILRRLPQNVSKSEIAQAQQQMDSIYNVIQQSGGSNFDEMVSRFSDDKRMQTFGALQVTENFADQVFALPVGSITRPFFSAYGLHIVKILDKGDLLTFDEMKRDFETRSMRREGHTLGTSIRINSLLDEYRFTPVAEAVQELYANGKTDKILFYLDGQPYDGQLFRQFALSHPMQVNDQYNAFIKKTVLDYENSRLEEKYPDFRLLIQEYHDGMLLFEISCRKVWDLAQNDEVGQSAYFTAHAKDYNWELPRFNGVVVHSSDRKMLKQIKKQLRKITPPLNKYTVEKHLTALGLSPLVVEDGVYAVGQNQYVDHYIFKVGPLVSMPDYPYTYVYGDKQKGPSDYREVRGQVISDYQNFLEQAWIKELRSNSKVEINQEVLKTVNNH